jgi:hypothetical protein
MEMPDARILSSRLLEVEMKLNKHEFVAKCLQRRWPESALFRLFHREAIGSITQPVETLVF